VGVPVRRLLAVTWLTWTVVACGSQKTSPAPQDATTEGAVDAATSDENDGGGQEGALGDSSAAADDAPSDSSTSDAEGDSPVDDARATDACTPKSCAALGYTCGTTCDGCGHLIDCGSCTNPQFCGGGGFNICGGNNGLPVCDASCGGCGTVCPPLSCAKLGFNCGLAGDGCGCLLDCGGCTAPEFCGGGGRNHCGLGLDGGPDACVPVSCANFGANCGSIPDGCGQTLDCGTCSGSGRCVANANNGWAPNSCCTPKTCADLGWTCGPAGDGCGGMLDCGSCAPPSTCGGGGVTGQCGGPMDGCAP
jgi:hypothetical protein